MYKVSFIPNLQIKQNITHTEGRAAYRAASSVYCKGAAGGRGGEEGGRGIGLI